MRNFNVFYIFKGFCCLSEFNGTVLSAKENSAGKVIHCICRICIKILSKVYKNLTPPLTKPDALIYNKIGYFYSKFYQEV